MIILIADKFEQSGLEALRAAGCTVLYEPDLKDDALAQRVATSGARVLVVRSTKVNAAALQAGALALVVRAGAGYNTIDVATASLRGIYVSNCPGKNAIAVAELTLGLILAVDRRIADNVADLKAGRWNKKEYAKARGLAGRTLGLLGYGNIGREVAHRAKAFGLNVLVWSRRFATGAEPAPDDVEVMATPADLFKRSDIVSLHLALAPKTRQFVGADLLAHLRPGTCFINTARAELVDSEALATAVRERGLKVGLDVFDNEPSAGAAEFTSPLAGLPGVYGTHHIGASTEQAQEAIAAETVRIILTFRQTGKVPNVVNLASKTPATHMLVVRHCDRPGVLAHVFDHLRRGGVNVQETENVIFEGAQAAVARINIDGAPSDALIADIKTGNSDIIEIAVVGL